AQPPEADGRGRVIYGPTTRRDEHRDGQPGRPPASPGGRGSRGGTLLLPSRRRGGRDDRDDARRTRPPRAGPGGATPGPRPRGRRAAVLATPRGLGFIPAFFGSLYAGGVPVPASPPRPNRPMTRLLTIVEDARPSVVLTCDSLRKDAERWSAGIPGLAGAE